MPRYTYRCDSCEKNLNLVHSMTDRPSDCPKCLAPGSLKRLPVSFTTVNKKSESKNEKAGSIVKEFIEEAKQDIKSENRRFKEELDL